MNVFVNRRLLEQTSFDSSSPNGLGTLVHQFEEQGEYSIAFLRGDQVLERVLLSVVEKLAAQELPPQQVTLDLEQVQAPAQPRPAGEMVWRIAEEAAQRYLIRVKGYAVFTTASAAERYAVVAERADGHGGYEAFDSRRLGAADLFTLTLLRPGTYSLTNVLANAQAKISVAYPAVGKTRYRPPEPLTIDCTEQGFQPDAIELQPAQGVVFRFQTPSRLAIELVEPNDGPEEPRPRRIAGWRKPRTPGEGSDTIG